MESGLNPKSITLGPDWLWHDHLAACAIAQQYSAIFFSLHFHYRKENNRHDLKKVLVFEIFICLEIG